MRRTLDLSAVVFLTAMVMLGIAAAVVMLRRPASSAPAGRRAHYLESPYQAQLFHRGQLHVQSNHGIGHEIPRDLSRAYERKGYEWVSITDQNTLTITSQFDTPNILAVPGAEAVFPFGRLLEYGVDNIPAPTTLQGAIDAVHRQAGGVVLARPKEPPAVGIDQVLTLKGLDAIEVYDARLHHDNPLVADATDIWDQVLSRGRRVWGVVGDDTLDIGGPNSTLGLTSVDVQSSEVSPPLIYDAIRRGAFVDSTGVRILGVDTTAGDSVRVITTDASSIRWFGRGGTPLATTNGPDGTYKVRWNEQYVRAVARRADGAEAWTQPVFVIP
ncbi:MAG: hypothetical protein ABR598_08550 [Candidatus Dormibacteria bacterium]